jgi:hypothetical protein
MLSSLCDKVGEDNAPSQCRTLARVVPHQQVSSHSSNHPVRDLATKGVHQQQGPAPCAEQVAACTQTRCSRHSNRHEPCQHQAGLSPLCLETQECCTDWLPATTANAAAAAAVLPEWHGRDKGHWYAASVHLKASKGSMAAISTCDTLIVLCLVL